MGNPPREEVLPSGRTGGAGQVPLDRPRPETSGRKKAQTRMDRSVLVQGRSGDS